MNTTENLEQRLQRVLALEAANAPVHDLTPEAFDARRTRNNPGSGKSARRLRARTTAVAAAGVAAAAGFAVFGPQGSGNSAFASWVSKPSTILAADAARLDTACRGAAATASSRAIIDARGHSAYVVYSDGKTWSDCLTTIPGMSRDKGMQQTILNVAPLTRVDSPDPSSAYPVVVDSAEAPDGNHVAGQAPPVMFVSGRVMANVASVTVETSKGSVVASVHGDYFAAWWPGNDADSAVVRAYDSSGQLVGTVDGLNCANARGQLSPRTQAPGRPSTGGCNGPS